MFCTNCGRPIEADRETCRFCKDLPELKFNYCQYCGEKIVGDSSVCSQCEQKLKRKQNYERNTSEINDDENKKDFEVNDLIEFIKKRSSVSIALWILVTIVEIVALVLCYKIYPLYASLLLNLYFLINSIKYHSVNEDNIEDIIDKMKRKSENLELVTGFAIFMGAVVGGLPAYYDLKTIKKSIKNSKGII